MRILVVGAGAIGGYFGGRLLEAGRDVGMRIAFRTGGTVGMLTVGLGLLVVWAGALQIMLDTGKNADWFESTRIIALAVISVLGFIAFILWEWTEEHPIIDLSLLKNFNFGMTNIVLDLLLM